MHQLDRAIINHLQDGFPVSERPYLEVADRLGTSEGELISRLRKMLDDGRLTRFGPLYNVEKMGGQFTLCAMQVPTHRLDRVAEQVNALREVAHNYERDHRLNMWFVVAAETPAQLESVVGRIERITGLTVHQFPKLDEYFIGLKLEV